MRIDKLALVVFTVIILLCVTAWILSNKNQHIASRSKPSRVKVQHLTNIGATRRYAYRRDDGMWMYYMVLDNSDEFVPGGYWISSTMPPPKSEILEEEEVDINSTENTSSDVESSDSNTSSTPDSSSDSSNSSSSGSSDSSGASGDSGGDAGGGDGGGGDGGGGSD